ncbi:MAG: Rieske (2Fe-2S) protein [Jiangellaceae bacterium]
MTDPDPTTTDPAPAAVGRRVVLLGAGAVGVAGVLAACNGGDETSSGSGDETTSGSGDEPTAGGAADTPADSPAQTPSPAGAPGVIALADVPVGGGVVIAAEMIVVTQPAAGDVKAFGSTCTHQGCQVNEVSDGEIKCPCHGSRYSIEDGSVVSGPAPEPLPAVGVAVEGDQVVLT